MTFLSRIAEAFETFGAAARTSAALRAHQRPSDTDLAQLGIDKSHFTVRV
ncbi:hypothetical protein GEU84_002705 [Fertoebacter nigrum]|uniref:DUF1127 domain-containing protein n=1 Tax=Fertoeibacter niger TaxID=2656921 RepID=A0A8X8KN12_9RHOB|nr:hypothetical protein [Fertoeibacter niger]NUB43281.1 hypothetical protein [Fertoeibacter niger]